MDEDTFLADVWGREFLYVPGKAGKFIELCSWEAANRILETHSPAPPRIKLVSKGRILPPNAFLNLEEEGYPRIIHSKVKRLLSEGAMLILNGVDDSHLPLRSFTMKLERFFQAQVFGDLHANWRSDKGFLLHWDPQEIFILQLSGRKHWQVYRPTIEHPASEVDGVHVPPTQSPVFDAVIEPGDLLYLPRGWWHVATPMDEPTLHLTIGVKPLSGRDFLMSVLDHAMQVSEVRADLPQRASTETKRTYKRALLENFLQAAESVDLDTFIAKHYEKIVRPRFDLPELD